MKVFIVAFLFMFGALVLLVDSVISTPIMYRSVTTGECVHVLSDSEYSCDNMPDKYFLKWVD